MKAKSGRVSGLKVCARGGMPKITLGITGLYEIFGRDYGIERSLLGILRFHGRDDEHSREIRLRKKVLLLIILHIQNSTYRPNPRNTPSQSFIYL